MNFPRKMMIEIDFLSSCPRTSCAPKDQMGVCCYYRPSIGEDGVARRVGEVRIASYSLCVIFSVWESTLIRSGSSICSFRWGRLTRWRFNVDWNFNSHYEYKTKPCLLSRYWTNKCDNKTFFKNSCGFRKII